MQAHGAYDVDGGDDVDAQCSSEGPVYRDLHPLLDECRQAHPVHHEIGSDDTGGQGTTGEDHSTAKCDKDHWTWYVLRRQHNHYLSPKRIQFLWNLPVKKLLRRP